MIITIDTDSMTVEVDGIDPVEAETPAELGQIAMAAIEEATGSVMEEEAGMPPEMTEEMEMAEGMDEGYNG